MSELATADDELNGLTAVELLLFEFELALLEPLAEDDDEDELEEADELVDVDPLPAAEPIVEFNCDAFPAEEADGGLPAAFTRAPPPPPNPLENILWELLDMRNAATAAATFPDVGPQEAEDGAGEQALDTLPGGPAVEPESILIEL